MKLLWYLAALLFGAAGVLTALAPILSERTAPGAIGGQVLFAGMALFLAFKALRKARERPLPVRGRSAAGPAGEGAASSDPEPRAGR